MKVFKEETQIEYHKALKDHNDFLADAFLPMFKPALNELQRHEVK